MIMEEPRMMRDTEFVIRPEDSGPHEYFVMAFDLTLGKYPVFGKWAKTMDDAEEIWSDWTNEMLENDGWLTYTPTEHADFLELHKPITSGKSDIIRTFEGAHKS